MLQVALSMFMAYTPAGDKWPPWTTPSLVSALSPDHDFENDWVIYEGPPPFCRACTMGIY